MNRRFPRTWQTVDENYRAFRQQQQEFDDLLHPPWKREMQAELEAQRRQREIEQLKHQVDDLLHPPKPNKPATRREGARLLSKDQVDRGKEQLKLKLNNPGEKNPRRWWLQKSAAKQIAKFLGLPERSAQTVEDEIVIPVFDECGLRKPKK